MPDRFAEVVEGLYRGGAPTPKEVSMLKDLWGINKIVSLDEAAGKDIQKICKKLGIQHIIWGLGDGKDPKVAALKRRIVPSLLLDGPTYIHCRHGKDRTGMAVAMFRVLNGWPLGDALAEAFKFGMGRGLSPSTKKSYYEAVNDFAKSLEDLSSADDAVSKTREANTVGPIGTGLDDSSIARTNRSFLPPHADIEFSHLSRLAARFASGRVYCKCKSSNVLKPKNFWYTSQKKAIDNCADDKGTLFSAKISSDAISERFDKPISKKLIHNILTKDIDVGILRDGAHLVLVPNILVDITEEDDVNEMFMPEVGTIDRSTSVTYTYPGSAAGIGGMPPSGAGAVELPYSGQSSM